jgi:hypothetical protein
MVTRGNTARVLLGLALVAGVTFFALWPEKSAQAVGANQNDKIVMATGQMDDGEAVFVLDTVTGNLAALRLHPKSGRFNASFVRNITRDFFDMEKAKSAAPQYTMVTGAERFSRSGPATAIPTVLYVAEATSGRMVAYTLMWNQAARNTVLDPNKPSPITKLDAFQLRGEIVRSSVE